MQIRIRRLAGIIGAAKDDQYPVPAIGPSFWHMIGTKAKVVYFNTAPGWAEIISINPQVEEWEALLSRVVKAGEMEGGH